MRLAMRVGFGFAFANFITLLSQTGFKFWPILPGISAYETERAS
jgi:hypothetical protein